jgi:nucleosome binding factor SPN SPT16 subunit
LPINGYAVPFHINTIKSAIKQEEGDYTVIRIMFVTPGQIVGKKEDTVYRISFRASYPRLTRHDLQPFEDVNSNFIRGVTFRSTDSHRFAEIHRIIMELKKAATKQEQERREMAEVVDQEKLSEDRARPLRLSDTWLRPSFEGKRSTGDVEVHHNGIRWASGGRNDHKIGQWSPVSSGLVEAQKGWLLTSTI